MRRVPRGAGRSVGRGSRRLAIEPRKGLIPGADRVTNLDGKPLSGLRKDVVVIKAKSNAEIEFVAANPGATLFHCHQQTHMDFGFMMLLRYVN